MREPDSTPPTSPAADLVIETLAASEGDLLRRVRSLKVDVATRDELLSIALEHLYQIQHQLERTRQAHARTLDDCRDRRDRTTPEALAA